MFESCWQAFEIIIIIIFITVFSLKSVKFASGYETFVIVDGVCVP